MRRGPREVCNLYREFRRVSNFRTGILSLLRDRATVYYERSLARSLGRAVNYSGRKASARARARASAIDDSYRTFRSPAGRPAKRTLSEQDLSPPTYRPGFLSVSLRCGISTEREIESDRERLLATRVAGAAFCFSLSCCFLLFVLFFFFPFLFSSPLRGM